MNGTSLLLTEELVATPRLATAILLAGAQDDPAAAVIASFAPGRAPGAAVAGRLNLVHRALAASDAPSAEAALLGACEAISPVRIVIWNCARAISALHALRLLDTPPHVECILPLEGSVPWDETAITAGRAANLIDRFVIEDPASRDRLVEAGVEPTRIEFAPVAPSADPAPAATRTLMIGGARVDRRDRTLSTVHARGAAVVAAALGWCPRAGTFDVTSGVDGAGAFASAARHGWTIHASHPAILAAVERAA